MIPEPPMRNGAGAPAIRGLAPVASVSRREAVMSQIRRAVVLGALRPGDKLTEISLARQLQVSRPTIREALSQFASDGLIIQEPYKGIRIARHTPQALMDIARTRMALDMVAARTILEDPSDHRLDGVLDAWRVYEGLEFDPDPLVRHEAHIGFHRGIWEASENDFLLRLWPVIEAQITVTLAQDQVLQPAGRPHTLHQTIVDAFRTKDLGRIEAAFNVHTIESTKRFIAVVEAAESD